MDIAAILAEDKIKEAMKNGEFDNLSCKGKPIDLRLYFKAPPHLRVTFDLLKKSNVLPDEVNLLKQIQLLKEKQDSCANEQEKSKLIREINFKTAQLNILKERYHHNRSIKF